MSSLSKIQKKIVKIVFEKFQGKHNVNLVASIKFDITKPASVASNLLLFRAFRWSLV